MGIDTTSSHGRLIFNVFASLVEFERDLIRERTQAGLQAARARGRPGGLSDQTRKKAIAAESIYSEGKLSVSEIARNLEISKSTLYKYLRHQGVEIGLTRKPE